MELFGIFFLLIFLVVLIVPIIVAVKYHKWLNLQPFSDHTILISIIVNVLLLFFNQPVGLISTLLAAYKLYKKHQEGNR